MSSIRSIKLLVVSGACATLGLLAAPADADARAAYLGRAPNTGENSCGTCHVSRGGGGPRNSFGQDFDINGQIWDSSLAAKDSDGDTFSNGQELGDPDGTWTQGDTPGAYASDPADASSKPAGDEPDMGGGDPDMGGGDPDMGNATPDMGGGTPDMGNTTPGNNTTPPNNNTPGNNTTPGNNASPGNNATAGNNTPGMTTTPPDDDDDDDEGCTQAGSQAPVEGALGLLAMLGFGLFWRRRR